MKANEFLDYVKTNIEPYGFKLYLGSGSNLNCDEERVQGYFDDESRILAVATGPNCSSSSVLEVLVHEYCHFEQWRKKVKVWKNSQLISVEKFKYFFDKNVKWSRSIQKYLDITIDLELDCEKRSIKLIKKLNLPIDVEVYAKKANSYLYFYSFLKERRNWYPLGKAPYKVKKIYDILPSDLKSGYKRIPKNLLNEFRKQYG